MGRRATEVMTPRLDSVEVRRPPRGGRRSGSNEGRLRGVVKGVSDAPKPNNDKDEADREKNRYREKHYQSLECGPPETPRPLRSEAVMKHFRSYGATF